MKEASKPFLKHIAIDAIETEGRLLTFREDLIAEITDSIQTIGLLTPVVLYKRRSGQMLLVAGRHRLEAARRCGFDKVPSLVFTRQGKAVDHWRRLAEVDENLIRRKITPADRAKLTTERKRLMAMENPASVKTGRPKSKGAQVEHVSFNAETAKATGRSEADVRRDVQRGKAIAADLLEMVRGTCLDKGTELDALAKLEVGEQRDLIERAARGEKVTAVKVEFISSEAQQLASLMKAWESACEKSRRQFLRRIGVQAAA